MVFMILFLFPLAILVFMLLLCAIDWMWLDGAIWERVKKRLSSWFDRHLPKE